MASSPAVSVCLPTMRVGGLDVVFAGLAGQQRRDFELIICDGIYDRRREIVAERARAYDFSVKHVPPLDGNPFPVASFCRYANTALVHARGERVLMITDYTWLPPDSVAAHAASRTPEEGGLMCPHQYAALPPLRADFAPYQNEDTDRYVEDLDAGRLDGCMWSILAEDFSGDPSQMPLDAMAGSDPKLGRGPGGCESWLFHGKHESVPRDVLLDLNGWDEELDGTHGWQDTELANRLSHQRQMKWQCLPIVAYIVNPRSVFPHARRLRPFMTNEAVWRDKEKRGYPIPNVWSLRERWTRLQSGI